MIFFYGFNILQHKDILDQLANGEGYQAKDLGSYKFKSHDPVTSKVVTFGPRAECLVPSFRETFRFPNIPYVKKEIDKYRELLNKTQPAAIVSNAADSGTSKVTLSKQDLLYDKLPSLDEIQELALIEKDGLIIAIGDSKKLIPTSEKVDFFISKKEFQLLKEIMEIFGCKEVTSVKASPQPPLRTGSS